MCIYLSWMVLPTSHISIYFICVGVTVPVVDLRLRGVGVPHLVEEATAGHHLSVLVKSCLMLTGKNPLFCLVNFFIRPVTSPF